MLWLVCRTGRPIGTRRSARTEAVTFADDLMQPKQIEAALRGILASGASIPDYVPALAERHLGAETTANLLLRAGARDCSEGCIMGWGTGFSRSVVEAFVNGPRLIIGASRWRHGAWRLSCRCQFAPFGHGTWLSASVRCIRLSRLVYLRRRTWMWMGQQRNYFKLLRLIPAACSAMLHCAASISSWLDRDFAPYGLVNDSGACRTG